MGFFSWTCKDPRCRKSILSDYALANAPMSPSTRESMQWRTEAVAFTPWAPETKIAGTYDGYGRILHGYAMVNEDSATDINPYTHEPKMVGPGEDDLLHPDVYHARCYERLVKRLSKRPGACVMRWSGGSTTARDQGFFIDGRGRPQW